MGLGGERWGLRQVIEGRTWTSVLTAALLTAAASATGNLIAPPRAASAASSPPRVTLYGDSLSLQAQSFFDFFTQQGSGAVITHHVYGGTAPCSYLNQMLADASVGAEDVAVLQFSGNAFGCMNYPPESQAYYDAYRQQVTQAAQAFSNAGIQTFIIGAPVNYSQVENADTSWDHLNEIYRDIAASIPRVTFVNAGASVEAAGQFAWTLPCLYFEAHCGTNGQNIVRAPDGGHFCPFDPNTGPTCQAWASGSLRFGMAMAGPVDDYLSSGSAPAYQGDALPPAGQAPTVAPGQVDPYLGDHDILTLVVPLSTGQSLRSLDGRYTATLQPDGDLVVAGPGGPVWATATRGTGASQLVLGSDGDLTLRAGAVTVWSSGTGGTPAELLAMQEDGRLVLYGPNGPLWSSPGAGMAGTRIVALAPTPSGAGYWMTDGYGRVFPFGDARNFGSLAGIRLNAPVVGIVATADGQGYWLVAQDGGVFSFGDARFYGSTGGIRLNQPVVGMAATPDGHGYWFVAGDGGVFSFGDARFYGSTGGITLAQPVVGMSATAHGYYLDARDGGIFSFGDARFHGSTGGVKLAAPVVGMAVDPATGGYWEVASDGGVFSFDAPFLGSMGGHPLYAPVTAMVSSPDGGGYRFVTTGGWVVDFGNVPYAPPAG